MNTQKTQVRPTDLPKLVITGLLVTVLLLEYYAAATVLAAGLTGYTLAVLFDHLL